MNENMCQIEIVIKVHTLYIPPPQQTSKQVPKGVGQGQCKNIGAGGDHG
jgi:hypothetical protein